VSTGVPYFAKWTKTVWRKLKRSNYGGRGRRRKENEEKGPKKNDVWTESLEGLRLAE